MSKFDLILCEDDEDDAIILCFTAGTKIIIDSLYAGIEWTRFEEMKYDVCCIDRESAMELAAEVTNAGLRVGFGEIASLEAEPARLQ